MAVTDHCARCERGVDTSPYADTDEYETLVPAEGEVTFICADCVTDADRRAQWEDEQILAAAMDSAGLLAGDAGSEAMSDTEAGMREELALVIYHSERPASRQIRAGTLAWRR